MPRFRLVTQDGADLGPFDSSVPDWAPGDEIPLGPGRRLRVIAVVWSSDDQPARLIVEPVGEWPLRRRKVDPGADGSVRLGAVSRGVVPGTVRRAPYRSVPFIPRTKRVRR